jgi:hypothetical protein
MIITEKKCEILTIPADLKQSAITERSVPHLARQKFTLQLLTKSKIVIPNLGSKLLRFSLQLLKVYVA